MYRLDGSRYTGDRRRATPNGAVRRQEESGANPLAGSSERIAQSLAEASTDLLLESL